MGQGAQCSGHPTNKNGQLIAEALLKAFNVVTAQGSALQALAPAVTPKK